ncbi:serine hydrolase domain-containing protein [Rossellomorea aquimaris]|uniref:serine hydrolase domain-containing protein n=1 Tax=Bacillaceae TaxID=186817 RepID=UPI0011EE4651|nr:serine hydrolase domain-containing protein [Bacillus sp. CH30_1T]KAA0561040.1 beta-lactamase family protein [Bacillus sp. CH30_1T]
MKPQMINIQKCMKEFGVTGLSMATIESGSINSTECFGLLEAGTDKRVESGSTFSACSISKFLTSILVMTLTEQGILDLDEDINKLLTSWKVPLHGYNGNVTLRQLLSHQSGVADPEGSFNELNPEFGTPTTVDLLEGKSPYCKVPIELKYQPEDAFHYSDAGFCIIQLLIEDVTGNPFSEVMSQHLFQPLHMENSTFDPPSQNVSCGHSNEGKVVNGKHPIYPYPAASGLWTTPSDLALVVVELMHTLKGESKLKLSSSKAAEMIHPQCGKAWTGLGVFLDQNDKGIEISSLGWGVGFQCMMVAYPHLERGLVIMTNTDLGVHQLKGIIGDVYKAFLND